MSATTAPSVIASEIPWRALYPSHEARVLLGDISKANFLRLTKSKPGQPAKLRAKKIGSRVYVERDALFAYISSLPDA